jgi:hypothetical protein
MKTDYSTVYEQNVTSDPLNYKEKQLGTNTHHLLHICICQLQCIRY